MSPERDRPTTRIDEAISTLFPAGYRNAEIAAAEASMTRRLADRARVRARVGQGAARGEEHGGRAAG